MKPIPIPTKLEYTSGQDQNTGIISIEPCYPGYGLTLTNALRRILLSSLSGAAITSFKIKNILHEFSSIDHVKEDVVEIALNLKQIRLKMFSDEPQRMSLSVKGEKKVSAKDIIAPSNVEIVNPRQHIATLTDKNAELEIEFIVQTGRGYLPTENREEELEVGMIAIDALFSPVLKVSYKIENIRVGQMTNWDKIIFEIETDGTIQPKEALHKASQYLIEHFQFIHLMTSEKQEGIAEIPKKQVIEEKMEMPVVQLPEVKVTETLPKVRKRGRPRKIKTEEQEKS